MLIYYLVVILIELFVVKLQNDKSMERDTYTIDEYNKKRNDLKNLMSSIESDCKDASARLGDVINKDPDKFAKTTHTSVNLICTYLRQTLLSDIVEMSKGMSKRYSDENNK